MGASLSPCREKGRLAPSGILPRWRCRHCGASVVTAPGAVATEKAPPMSHGNIPTNTEIARAERRANLARSLVVEVGFRRVLCENLSFEKELMIGLERIERF